MAISDARHRANEKYNAKAYDEIKVRVAKGRKAELQAFVERHGMSVNGFINGLIDEAMERERGWGGATGAGAIPIFSDSENTPNAVVGASPTQDKESLPAEQIKGLSPDDWAVWAQRQDDESLESWRQRLNRSHRGLSTVDVVKRLGRLSEEERDILTRTDPESVERFREKEERKRQQEEEAAKPVEVGELPF